MHLVVSWDVAAGPQRDDIVAALLEVLRPYPWVRPLTTFYIVRATGDQREAIVAGLLAVTERFPNRISLVVSPLMQGAYAGALEAEQWQQINGITGA
jgi:hypothetical protein